MTLKISVISGSGEADTELIEEQIQGLDYELEKFECASDGETIEAMAGADIVINAGVPISREVIEETEGVQAIMVGSHGFNHIDHEAATEQGIMVVNSAGFCTEEVSNHAILLLLACAKKLAQLNDLVKAGKWGAETRAAIMPMVPIYDQTLGLVAFGNIARATARKPRRSAWRSSRTTPTAHPGSRESTGSDWSGVSRSWRRSRTLSRSTLL